MLVLGSYIATSLLPPRWNPYPLMVTMGIDAAYNRKLLPYFANPTLPDFGKVILAFSAWQSVGIAARNSKRNEFPMAFSTPDRMGWDARGDWYPNEPPWSVAVEVVRDKCWRRLHHPKGSRIRDRVPVIP